MSWIYLFGISIIMHAFLNFAVMCKCLKRAFSPFSSLFKFRLIEK